MTQEMAASRVVAGDVGRTFGLVLPMPLEELFVHWHGPIPPIRSTRGSEPWQSPGQRRRVDLVGPGWMNETLTEVAAPHHFSYRLDEIHGPMRALIASVDGRWEFTPDPAGTEITWSWSVTARPLMRWLLPAFARLWRGYAARALLELDRLLGRADD